MSVPGPCLPQSVRIALLQSWDQAPWRGSSSFPKQSSLDEMQYTGGDTEDSVEISTRALCRQESSCRWWQFFSGKGAGNGKHIKLRCIRKRVLPESQPLCQHGLMTRGGWKGYRACVNLCLPARLSQMTKDDQVQANPARPGSGAF